MILSAAEHALHWPVATCLILTPGREIWLYRRPRDEVAGTLVPSPKTRPPDP